jgi:Flp pilus assembly CpaE family ATPase
MSERPRILLALTPLVEREVEAELFGAAPTVEIVASAAVADELPELARTHAADALLVSPDLAGLTGAHCAAANAAGLRVIGLALDDVGREALATLGVDEVVVLPLEPDVLANAARGPAVVPAPPAPPPSTGSPKPHEGSSVVAVIGSKGAPGSSECAASLAALAATRWDTVLVEVDALGSGLDVRLDADAHQGSLAGIARAVEHEEARLDALLERWLVERPGWPRTLLGAPDPVRDLPRPGAAANAIRALARLHALVVCDVGFLIAPDDADGVSPLVRIHRETVAVADAVVLVLGARDVQLRQGLAQLTELSDRLAVEPGRLRVVVSGVGAPGAADRLEVEAALLPRLAEHGLGVDAWLAWDARGLANARKRGLPIAAARPRGPYGRGLEVLLDALFVPVAPIARARKQRLAPATPATAEVASTEEVAVPWHR